MELFYIPIIVVVLVFLLFIILNILQKKRFKKKEKKEETAKETKPEVKEETKKVYKPIDIDLNLKPDFSDIVKIEDAKTKQKQTSSMAVKKNNIGIGDAYKREEMPRNSQLSNEISNLSPELKAIIFGNILNEDR